LLIVSWVTPTSGFTAKKKLGGKIPGNRCSQPLILRPFGRSAQELPVEYQVEPLSSTFRGLQLRKAIPVDRGQDLEISRNPWSKQRFHSDSNKFSTKIMGKSHRKEAFLCVYPLLVLRPDLDSSVDSRKVSQGIFQKKNPKN
jgi:hypothetical protein